MFLLGSAGRGVNPRGKGLSVRHFPHVEKDKTITGGVIQVSRLQFDGFFGHSQGSVPGLWVDCIEIRKRRVGRCELRIQRHCLFEIAGDLRHFLVLRFPPAQPGLRFKKIRDVACGTEFQRARKFLFRGCVIPVVISDQALGLVRQGKLRVCLEGFLCGRVGFFRSLRLDVKDRFFRRHFAR